VTSASDARIPAVTGASDLQGLGISNLHRAIETNSEVTATQQAGNR
jgi:hypothetical protein